MEKAYKEIFKVLNKYKDDVVFDIDDLKRKSEYHLFGLKLRNEYGLDINPKKVNNLNWFKIDEFWIGDLSIGLWGEKYGRTISWSDDGRQPDDEYLFKIGFSTGAFIFGKDYPTELFNKFFVELSSYKPKYIDTVNHCLYWSLDTAKDIFNNYDNILKKYLELNKEDAKLRKKKELEKQLAELS